MSVSPFPLLPILLIPLFKKFQSTEGIAGMHAITDRGVTT